MIRESGRTSGDVALALLFYGGIAGGVLITGLAGQSAATLNTLPVRLDHHDLVADVWVTVALARGRRGRSRSGCRPQLFAVAQDQEFAQVAGLNVRVYNLLVSVMAAVTVTVAMRTVGLLLVSALMVVPVATSQQVTRAFRTTLVAAMGLGMLRLGRRASRRRSAYARRRARRDDRAAGAGRLRGGVPGRGAGCVAGSGWRRRSPRPPTPSPSAQATPPYREDHVHEHGQECGHAAVPHGDHVDYVHDGHRHAPHGSHYDEH